MRTTLTLLALLLVLPVAAEEITVDKILAAHSFGAPAESILARINDPANTVPSIPAADVAKLRAAMVPEPVVAALLAKAPPAAPPSPAGLGGTSPTTRGPWTSSRPSRPGPPRSSSSTSSCRTACEQRPSLNDLIYLKENKVPEGDHPRAHGGSPRRRGGRGAGRSTAPPPVPSEIEVDGLVRKTGLWSKNRSGKLVLKADKIEWLDGTNQADSFEMFPAGLKAVQHGLSRPARREVLPRGRVRDGQGRRLRLRRREDGRRRQRVDQGAAAAP